MDKRRNILPAIYNTNLEKYHWNPPGTFSKDNEVPSTSNVAELQNVVDGNPVQYNFIDLSDSKYLN